MHLVVEIFLSSSLYSACIAMWSHFWAHYTKQVSWWGGGRFIHCQQKACRWGEDTVQTVPFLSLQEAFENKKLIVTEIVFYSNCECFIVFLLVLETRIVLFWYIILASSRAEPAGILFLIHEWTLSNAIQSLCKSDQIQRWSVWSGHIPIVFVCTSIFH